MAQESWMLDKKEWERLRWQCRRGMLELDVILLPFMEEDLPQLESRIQLGFVRLLEASDLELFRWLLRGEQPVGADMRELIEVIREHHQARHLG
jgi:antitoxin CptB